MNIPVIRNNMMSKVNYTIDNEKPCFSIQAILGTIVNIFGNIIVSSIKGKYLELVKLIRVFD